jgi:cold shock CspA family protein
MERLAADFPDGDGLVETINESTKAWKVRWQFVPTAVQQPPGHDGGNPQRHGLIKRIYPEEKFGFITDGEGRDWFFHLNHLSDPKQWESLTEGMKVGFAVGNNRTGECAVEVCRT